MQINQQNNWGICTPILSKRDEITVSTLLGYENSPKKEDNETEETLREFFNTNHIN